MAKTKINPSKKTSPANKGRRGLNIFYFGKGKGKTTAVMGLAARAAGSGMSVFILQFVKASRPKKGQRLQIGEWPLSFEIKYFEEATKALKRNKEIGSIATDQIGAGFVGILGDKKEKAVHVKQAKKGLAMARQILKSDKYDLVILDELISAVELNLISESDAVKLIKSKPKHIHLAYTGHDSFKGIVEISDTVSDIGMIKHPYYKGILAQRGIDF